MIFPISKFTIWVIGLVSLLLISCVSTGRETAPRAKLEKLEELRLQQTFGQILNAVQAQKGPDSLKPFLSRDSRLWITELEQAARRDSRAQLEERSFDQLLIILGIRLLDRKGLMRNTARDTLLHLALNNQSPLRKALSLNLGTGVVKRERGYLGLAQTPLVPLLHFKLEDGEWRLDLRSTMPLVTRGLETIGPKKNWTPTHTALHLLNRAYRLPAEEDLLEP